MSMREAAMVAVFAGIVVAGLVWYALGMLGNIQFMLNQRARTKAEAETPAPEAEE